jgi:hypothetical protein
MHKRESFSALICDPHALLAERELSSFFAAVTGL